MIRIYGGAITEGLNDGIEVGTEENPILFDGLYPAPNGEATKELSFAIRSDGEVVNDVCLVVAMLDETGKDTDINSEIFRFSYYYNMYPTTIYNKNKILAINPQTLLFKEINATNQIITIKAMAKGTEDTSVMPDLRGKVYIISASAIMTKLI